MRQWFFHPLLFYPLCAALATAVIVFSLQPQAWPRPAAPVSGVWVEETLVLDGAAFEAPASSPQQAMTVMRNFLGQANSLRIAQLPNQGAPTPQENGAVIVLSPEFATALEGKPLSVEITYRPLPVNAAFGLAVSLRGSAPSPWVSRETPPQPARIRFSLPAQADVSGIGLRALSPGDDQAYGLEITRIRITPQRS